MEEVTGPVVNAADCLTKVKERAESDTTAHYVMQQFNTYLQSRADAIGARTALIRMSHDAMVGLMAMDLIDAGKAMELLPAPVVEQADTTDLKSVPIEGASSSLAGSTCETTEIPLPPVVVTT